MKKPLLFIIGIISFVFITYWIATIFQFTKGVKEDAKKHKEFIEKHNSGVLILNDTTLIESKNLKNVLLSESKLGYLELDQLTGNNIIENIELKFPGFKINKKIGRQDGPSFILYQGIYMDELIFFISMDSENPDLIKDISTENDKIIDEYGVFVGMKSDSIQKLRPNLNFHSDLHQNIYASINDSKIEYRLKGKIKNLNDSLAVSKNLELEKWQVEEMEVEYIVWKK